MLDFYVMHFCRQYIMSSSNALKINDRQKLPVFATFVPVSLLKWLLFFTTEQVSWGVWSVVVFKWNDIALNDKQPPSCSPSLSVLSTKCVSDTVYDVRLYKATMMRRMQDAATVAGTAAGSLVSIDWLIVLSERYFIYCQLDVMTPQFCHRLVLYLALLASWTVGIHEYTEMCMGMGFSMGMGIPCEWE